MELRQIEQFVEAAAKHVNWEWMRCPNCTNYHGDEGYRWLAVEECDKEGTPVRAHCTDCGNILYWEPTGERGYCGLNYAWSMWSPKNKVKSTG